jgi:hypothetical protein
MEPHPLADELPLTGKKAYAARDADSTLTRWAWLLALVFVGFLATSAAIRFGPRAVEYVGDLARLARPTFGAKTGPGVAPRFNPWALPELRPVWDTSNSPVFQPPSIPQFNIPQGQGFSAPYPGGGVRSSGFTIRR